MLLISILFLLLPALLVWAAVNDALSRLIPNGVVAALALTFPAAALLAGWPSSLVAAHFACGAVVCAATFGLFSLGVFGGGDAKLFSAAALWFGWDWIAAFTIATSLFGGVLALLYVLPRLIGGRGQAPATLPYGLAIAAGGLYLFPDWAIWLANS